MIVVKRRVKVTWKIIKLIIRAILRVHILKKSKINSHQAK